MEYTSGGRAVDELDVKKFNVSVPAKAVWFDDCLHAELLSGAAVKDLSQNINHIIFSDNYGPKLKQLAGDKFPRIIMLSLPHQDGSAEIFLGSGFGVLSAVENAKRKIILAHGSLEHFDWLKVDVVTTVKPCQIYHYPDKLKMDRSIEGLAFEKNTAVFLLPEQLVANSYVSSDGKVQMKIIMKKFAQLNIDGNKLVTFKARSFFVSRNIISPLVRGNQCVYDLEKETLLKSAFFAGKYLLSAVKDDGSFLISYRSKQDKEAEKNNMSSHAGAIYSMLELYEVSSDAALLEKSRLAIDYLVKQVGFRDESSRRLAFVVENDFIHLGDSALAALALCKFTKITGDAQYLDLIEQLGNWIRSVQAESGEFFVHKQSYPEGEITDFISDYYPGEAVFALCRIYELLPKPEWVDTAERGAKWLINIRDKEVNINAVKHDHWLLYTLNELYRLRPSDIYMRHAFLMSDAIMRAQHRFHKYPDWNGGYYTPPQSIPAATRSEGLCAAYRLAKDFDHEDRAMQIIESITMGVAFQLRTQFQPVNAMYLDNPQAALGGFKKGLTMNDVSVDSVWQCVSSILALYQILL